MEKNGASRVKSMNVANSDSCTFKSKSKSPKVRKPGLSLNQINGVNGVESKPKRVKPVLATEEEVKTPVSRAICSLLKRHEQMLGKTLSMDASCSSDASSVDSLGSRASTGRLVRSSSGGMMRRKLRTTPTKTEKVVPDSNGNGDIDLLQSKRRCTWVTPNTDPSYAAFHDEEWGVPVHDDRKLFELLVLSGALAELPWPTILTKRHLFREVFADFDPVAVSKLNEKKICAPGSAASSLLSELKLRAIMENARQISKIIDEVGSFDNYIWSFVNHKPIVSRFRYPRQVPVKTPKADVISKDLVRRGFRSVSPTVIYSFMQVAGITNDHLIGCYRFEECLSTSDERKDESDTKSKDEKLNTAEIDAMDLGLARAIAEMSIVDDFISPANGC